MPARARDAHFHAITIPILVHRLIALGHDGPHHLVHIARVGDLELRRVAPVRPRITAHAGARAGRKARGPQVHQAVAEGGALPGGNGDAGARQEEAQGQQELDELPVIRRIARLEVAFGRIEARQGDADLGLQVAVIQVAGVQTGEEDFPALFAHADERTDVDGPEPGPRAPFGGVQAEAVIGLGSGQVHLAVDLPVVHLLVEGQAVDAGLFQSMVVRLRHGKHLDGDRCEVLLERRSAASR